MKKLLVFILCMGLAVSLAACGGTASLPSGGSASSESAPSSGEGVPPTGEPSSQAAPESTPPQSSPSSEEASQPQPSEAGSPGGESSQSDPVVSDEAEHEGSSLEEAEMKLYVEVGGRTFTATLEENAAVDAFVELMREAPVVLQMSDYSGFEKVGSLGTSLPASNRQTTTQAGDIVLYNGSQIVLFYGSNSWSYTRLGKIDDLTGWEEALGSGDVTVTFSIGG